MAKYDHIIRVVIRKPTSPQDWLEALKLLTAAKHELDALQHATEIMVVPPTVSGYQMAKVDHLISEAVQKAGFANADDMKYFIENFQKM